MTWRARYILDLVFCFSYTDCKFICYLLLFAICLFIPVIYLFTRNTSTSCEISSNLVKTVVAFLFFFFCLLEASFSSSSCISCWVRIGNCWLYCQKQPSHRCSYEKLFWKYAANLLRKNRVEVWFNKVAKQLLFSLTFVLS